MASEETTAVKAEELALEKKIEKKQEPTSETPAKADATPVKANDEKKGLALPLAPMPRAAPVVDGEKKGKKKRKSAEAAVTMKKLTKRFGVKTAVDEVTLTIGMGSVYGLIGPNGAGKTTTFSMLAGFLHPTAGTLEVLGFPPTNVDELRSRLGVLPQDALLPASDKVGDFLIHMARLQDIPKDKAEEAAREVLEEVEGKEWWGQKCGSLSHGMAKRVALAQAFLCEPDVVLLDEPTAGLDPRVAYEVRQTIKQRKGRCTIIISSHNLQELEEICDAAVILDRGRVVASGSMTELTAASEEVHVKVAPGTKRATSAGAVPMQALRDLPMVKSVEFDEEGYEIVVYFERKQTDAETVIAHVLWILLNNQVRISGVSKGRGLEQRVMDLT
jgi:ABC-type multidrug transport system ATPase subunit